MNASATNTIVTSDAKASINISEQKEKQPIDDITIDANNDDKGDQGFTTPPAGTIASSTFNICNNMIGTGCLAMPYAIKEIGLATGLMVIIFVAVGTQAALVMLAKSAHMMGNNRNASFHLAALKTYPSASALLDFAVVLKCFGTGVSYVVVAADLIPTIISGLVVDMDPESILLDRQFWVKMSVLVVTPLALLRRLDSLKYLSLLAVLAAVYLVAIVIGFAIAMPDGMPQGEWVKEVHWFRGDISTIIRISPVFVFAFNCHENVFSTSNELQDNTLVRMKKIINISVSFVFVLYLCVVVFGYLSIGDSLSSNIIQNYPTGPIVIGGKISIVILVLLSVPVQLHPLRVAVNDIVNTIITKVQLRRGVADSEVDHDMGTVRFATLTICLLLLKMVTASVITDLATILAYVGATGTTTISYILPGILFNKLSAVNGQKMNFERCVSLFLAGFGVSFMIVSVILQTIKLVG